MSKEVCESEMDPGIGITCIQVAANEPDFSLCEVCLLVSLRTALRASEERAERYGKLLKAAQDFVGYQPASDEGHRRLLALQQQIDAALAPPKEGKP